MPYSRGHNYLLTSTGKVRFSGDNLFSNIEADLNSVFKKQEFDRYTQNMSKQLVRHPTRLRKATIYPSNKRIR